MPLTHVLLAIAILLVDWLSELVMLHFELIIAFQLMRGHCFTVCYVQYVLLSVVIQPSWQPNPIKVIIIIKLLRCKPEWTATFLTTYWLSELSCRGTVTLPELTARPNLPFVASPHAYSFPSCVTVHINMCSQCHVHCISTADKNSHFLSVKYEYNFGFCVTDPLLQNTSVCAYCVLSLIHIWRCRRSTLCRSRWSPYH